MGGVTGRDKKNGMALKAEIVAGLTDLGLDGSVPWVVKFKQIVR